MNGKWQKFRSIDAVSAALSAHQYVVDRSLATTVFLALTLGKPIFLEGEPGVGKTELAKVLTDVLESELIRLQCYEGLDSQSALYEWNYPRQMLEVRLQEARGVDKKTIGEDLFSEEFLLERPLLRAIRSDGTRPPVLLIDEVDRSDEEFEAFLLEVLSDFQITIPELGTLKAPQPPVVVLTSNRTRELHDALKRRCLYHWIDYPDVKKESKIVCVRAPNTQEELASQLARFMHRLRQEDIYKKPGIAETIDWAEALIALGVSDLEPQVIRDTLGCILKYKSDVQKVLNAGVEKMLQDAMKLPSTA